jgi:hypothetical protein
VARRIAAVLHGHRFTCDQDGRRADQVDLARRLISLIWVVFFPSSRYG